VLKRFFILDKSNHDEGLSYLEEGGNRATTLGYQSFSLNGRRFGLADEAFTFGQNARFFPAWV
jgi:hypothetical protein